MKMQWASQATAKGGFSSPKTTSSEPVLGVADVLHPVDRLALQPLLDRDVSHGRRWLGSVPVFLARRKPHDVPGMDLLDRPAVTLNPAAAIRNDQGLAKGMGVPGGASAGFKCHSRPGDARGIGC